MIPSQCVESVSVAEIPPYTEESTVTYCDVEQHNRCKASVTFGPGLAPVAYHSTIICYTNSTRKRHISQVDYETKMKPLIFGETIYVRDKGVEKSYAALLDYHVGGDQRWYKTDLRFNGNFSLSTNKLGETEKSSLEMDLAGDGVCLDANHNRQVKNMNGWSGNEPRNVSGNATEDFIGRHGDAKSQVFGGNSVQNGDIPRGLRREMARPRAVKASVGSSDYAFRSGPYFFDASLSCGEPGKDGGTPLQGETSTSTCHNAFDGGIKKNINGYLYMNGHETYEAEMNDDVLSIL